MSWNLHPAFMDKKSSLGEKAADSMKAVFSTWTALIIILVGMTVWMVSGGFGTDPKPFILLNLCLSCIAALQCFILLIAAKRTDVISSQLAMHDYNTNVEAKKEIENLKSINLSMQQDIKQVKTNTDLLEEILRHLGDQGQTKTNQKKAK